MRLNVLDFTSPDAALAAASDGDAVYFPAGPVYSPSASSAAGYVIDKAIAIIGDGPGGTGLQAGAMPGTLIRPATDNLPVFTIVPPVGQIHVRGVQLRGLNPLSGTSTGIVCQGNSQGETSDITIDDVLVADMPGDGIKFVGSDGAVNRIARVTVANTRITNCGGVGMRFTNAYDVLCRNNVVSGNKKGACTATNGSIALYACDFDGNGVLASAPYDAVVQLVQCAISTVEACRFTSVNLSGKKRAVIVKEGATVIGACYFEAGTATGTQGVYLTGNGGGPYCVLSQRFKSIATLVKVDAGARNVSLLAQYDASGNGVMDVAPGTCVFGAPHVLRSGGVAGSRLAGMAVPWCAGDPLNGVRPGMLVYNTVLGVLRFRTQTSWKTVGVI